MKRLMIAAPKSGAGKTLVTCGLLKALSRRGFHPAAFKCGPDFIDPMFHRKVLGIPGANLDSFFLDAPGIRNLFAETCRDGNADFALIEGVMGYYDGVNGKDGFSLTASSYDIARITDTPVILLLDGKGSSLSLAAEVRGFQNFRPDSRIAGVILNRTKPMTAKWIGREMERYCGIPVLGSLPENPAFSLKSRHLGLVLPEEVPDLLIKIGRLAEEMEETMDIDALISTAREGSLPREEQPAMKNSGMQNSEMQNPAGERPLRIAVARDEAFSFYYPENLKLLKKCGAQLIPFSPLHDRALPGDIGGFLLGGGYPELYTEKIAENDSMRMSIRLAVSAGMPYIAECGGFLALHAQLEGADGVFRKGFGIFPGKAWKTSRLGRFGYARFATKSGEELRGHEFHYWESDDPGADWQAEKPSGRTWKAVHDNGRGQIAGFPHLYWLSDPKWIQDWLSVCDKFRNALLNQKTGV